MPENRRNRKYNRLKSSSSSLLTERSEERSNKRSSDEQVQPKILLKSRPKESSSQASIVKDHGELPAKAATSAITIQTKEKENHHNVTVIEQPTVSVQQMTRPIGLANITNQTSLNNLRIFEKSNTDFLVIGVIGTQGVGKSTIMNLLTTGNIDSNAYSTIFKKKEGIFAIKNKSIKSQSWLDSTELFITKDRIILLDCPPVLADSYKKDIKANELDDFKMIIFLLTVCHLVILVQDDYFNLSLIRLLQFSEFTKPNQNPKSFSNEYFPNILFVKNRAKRVDFSPSEKHKTERIIKYVFKDSKLKINIGQTDKANINKLSDQDGYINYFVFPEIKDENASSYYPNLEKVVKQFRQRVFASPRNQIYSSNTDLTEINWCELVTATAMSKNNFFLSLYEDIRRFQLHAESEHGN